MTSRRELYAHGEPFGDSATRRKIDGKGYICGFGGDSKSSSSSSTTNLSTATDNRQALASGAIGASGSGRVSINQTDPGALKAMESALLASNAATQSAISASQKAAASAAAAASQAAAQATASANKSLDSSLAFATKANATNAQGFESLLSTGLDLFSKNLNLLDKAYTSTEKTQQFTADAYQTASAELSGSLDNKTIMILGLGAIAAVVLFAVNKKG
jgi:hypothetical protein